jgi:hypothetical protein
MFFLAMDWKDLLLNIFESTINRIKRKLNNDKFRSFDDQEIGTKSFVSILLISLCGISLALRPAIKTLRHSLQ